MRFKKFVGSFILNVDLYVDHSEFLNFWPRTGFDFICEIDLSASIFSRCRQWL